jgi:hypothetical protein
MVYRVTNLSCGFNVIARNPNDTQAFVVLRFQSEALPEYYRPYKFLHNPVDRDAAKVNDGADVFPPAFEQFAIPAIPTACGNHEDFEWFPLFPIGTVHRTSWESTKVRC